MDGVRNATVAGKLVEIVTTCTDGSNRTTLFEPDSPKLTQGGPECVAGDPPPWALAD